MSNLQKATFMRFSLLPLLLKFLLPLVMILFHYRLNMKVLSTVFHTFNPYKIKNRFPPHLIRSKLMRRNIFHVSKTLLIP